MRRASRPKIGDPVYSPRIGDKRFDDVRCWPKVAVFREQYPSPTGYWLVRLTGWKRDTWIEEDADPNGENPYWIVRSGRVP